MIKNTIKPLAIAIIMAGVAGCEPEIEREFPANAAGQADFSTYVALGNSLTAGFSDSFLNRAGQLNSYPAILADKMAAVTPDFNFVQPLLPAGVVEGTLQLTITDGKTGISPSQGGISRLEAGKPVRGTFQNLGVPGAKAADLLTAQLQSDNAKFFFNRLSQNGQSMVQMAAAQKPTFFTLWIGANDILEYATYGAEDDPSTSYQEIITNPEEYRTSLEAIIRGLKESNPTIGGALANIPSIKSIPYFNVVPWNAFVLQSQAQVDALNQGIAAQIVPVVRKQVILGVITEGARRQIIAAVSPQVVYKQAYDQAKAGGATDEQADQMAQQYVASDDGKAAIQNLSTSLITTKQPAPVHAIVEQQLGSDAVQANIQQTNQVANQKDSEGKLAEVLGAEGAATVNFVQKQNIDQLKAGKFYPTFELGANGFIVASNHSPTGIKQLTAEEKMLLKFQSRTAEEFDPAAGKIIVPDKYALDIFELQEVSAAIEAYNTIIADVASANGFALVDVNNYFNQLVNTGLVEEGIPYNTDYADISVDDGDGVTIFSLDGVHPNQRGYALIARKFVEAINSHYNAKLPMPVARNYPLIPLPAN